MKYRMDKLSESMQRINSLAGKINVKLRPKQESILKLDIVNRDLQKLNKLCEFPQILK